MKKFIIAFGIGISIFFAGFSSAQNTGEIMGKDLSIDNCVDFGDLQGICQEAIEARFSAAKWGTDNSKRKEAKSLYEEGESKILEALKTDDAEPSKLKKEKLLMESIKNFKQALRIERKPKILSGGILPGPEETENGTDYMTNKFLTKFVNGSIVFLLSIGVLILIIGGIMFLISSGDSEQLTKAKDTIFWGIVGIVLAIMSYAIVKFVVGLDFGV